MRFLDAILFLLLGMVLGAFVYYRTKKTVNQANAFPAEKQYILLQRLEKAAKLISLEASFEHKHTYEDYILEDIGTFE